MRQTPHTVSCSFVGQKGVENKRECVLLCGKPFRKAVRSLLTQLSILTVQFCKYVLLGQLSPRSVKRIRLVVSVK